jgi:hypothetical protein
MQHGDYGDQFFVRSISNHVFSHDLKPQRPGAPSLAAFLAASTLEIVLGRERVGQPPFLNALLERFEYT